MTGYASFGVLYISMKKKTVHTKSSGKSTRRSSSPKQTVFFRRILIITTCLVLAVIGINLIDKSSLGRAVAGTSIMRGMFVQGTVSMPTLKEANTYNIYYKEAGAKEFINAARGISPNTTTYTISYLKKNVNYQYRFAAVDGSGREILFSEILPLTNIEPM